MAVYVKTKDPSALLRSFRDKIEQSELEGKIMTWKSSNDKRYFTHGSKQWEYAAWMKPVVEVDRLAFYIIKSKNKIVTQTAYGYYHGHIVETFLNHFDRETSSVEATALPVTGDNVG